jgi:hypothetical protein
LLAEECKFVVELTNLPSPSSQGRFYLRKEKRCMASEKKRRKIPLKKILLVEGGQMHGVWNPTSGGKVCALAHLLSKGSVY